MWEQLSVVAKWELLYDQCDCERRIGVTRAQFFGVICCYEVVRSELHAPFGAIGEKG